MANGNQLMGMIRSHATGDTDMFMAVAEDVAADAEKAGRTRLATDLRRALDDAREQKVRRREPPTPISRVRGELASVVETTYPILTTGDLILDAGLRKRIVDTIREQRERGALEAKGLSPRRKLLLAGPPGTGKTMTAQVIASELSLPLFTILLDGIFTKFMGEAAAKLRIIFDHMKTTRGVYFFDEVDALAGSRNLGSDIGEARRVLNSLLQFLDGEDSSGIVVAATNHPEILDRAVFRRFQKTFQFTLPSPDQVVSVVRNAIVGFDQSALDWTTISNSAGGLSHHDIVSAAEDAGCEAVLNNEGVVETGMLVSALEGRRAPSFG